MVFSKMRTALKNRMHSKLARVALSIDTESDIFALVKTLAGMGGDPFDCD
jgi:hypothetical protein